MEIFTNEITRYRLNASNNPCEVHTYILIHLYFLYAVFSVTLCASSISMILLRVKINECECIFAYIYVACTLFAVYCE